MRVDELEGEALNHWTALADGCEYRDIAIDGDFEVVDKNTGRQVFPDYVKDWAWCGPLIEKFDISIGTRPMSAPWEATLIYDNDISAEADDPKTAICRAVVASVYGEEIDDEM